MHARMGAHARVGSLSGERKSGPLDLACNRAVGGADHRQMPSCRAPGEGTGRWRWRGQPRIEYNNTHSAENNILELMGARGTITYDAHEENNAW